MIVPAVLALHVVVVAMFCRCRCLGADGVGGGKYASLLQYAAGIGCVGWDDVSCDMSTWCGLLWRQPNHRAPMRALEEPLLV